MLLDGRRVKIMRVLELEIHNVRGIPHILLKPDGKNRVAFLRHGLS